MATLAYDWASERVVSLRVGALHDGVSCCKALEARGGWEESRTLRMRGRRGPGRRRGIGARP